MPQPWGILQPNDHIAIFGLPTSGKTSEARHLAARAHRVVFFDAGGDLEDEGLCVEPGDLLKYPDLLRGQFVRVVAVANAGAADAADELRDVLSACKGAVDEGGILLVLDEVGVYSANAQRELVRLHAAGHKHRSGRIASIAISQRAVDLPRGARAMATEVRSFLQVHPDDLDALADVYGEDYAAAVRAWKPGDPPAVWRRPTVYPPSR